MVTIQTSNPHNLLFAFRQAISKGHIETWFEVDGYFTHSPAQWARKAWFYPTTAANELQFSIVPSEGGAVTTEVYAVYHGRLIETMLAHFDSQFSSAASTAMPAATDLIAA